ncbi:MAG: MtnX-like HAD-IB family phosphatase [Ignavibacteria bacterium]|nr:MtnX-like HAD-IB family phosphatase [Ignavibacteria bacterium]
MKVWKPHIFSDFDGTITISDVCIDIIRKFGKLEPYLSELASGKLPLKDFWVKTFQTFPENLTLDQIISFVAENAEVDKFFPNFVSFCQQNSIPFVILSDGFDFYIKTILEKLNLSSITFYANSINKTGRFFTPIYNFASESCFCYNVGSCKRNIALSLLSEDEVLIYVGDGYSDFCMVEYADIVFAKGILSSYCNKYRIPHYNYKTFYDILIILKKLIERKELKPRRQAQLKRKKAFEIE